MSLKFSNCFFFVSSFLFSLVVKLASFIQYVRKFFLKTNISYRTCAYYVRVRISAYEMLVFQLDSAYVLYVLNEWPPLGMLKRLIRLDNDQS